VLSTCVLERGKCTLPANIKYTAVFDIINPAKAQDSPDIDIAFLVMPFEPTEVDNSRAHSLPCPPPPSLEHRAFHIPSPMYLHSHATS
jgi:hypothetical protein